MAKTLQTGIYRDVDFETYLAWDAVLSLEPHELSVIADWVKERLDGRRLD